MGGKWISFVVIQIVGHLLLFLLQFNVTTGVVDQKSTLYEAVQVVDYQQFSSVQVLRFQIPSQAIKAVFRFTSFTSALECREKAIYLHLQYGSLPLVTPHNETFPSRFYLGRTESHAFSVPRVNQSILYTLQHPLAGDWYAVVFTTDSDDRITQKGLGPDCKYFVEPALIVQTQREVKTLSDDHGSVNIKPESKKYVRFRVGGSVWLYVVRVTACTLTDDSINVLCNITVAARSLALPTLAQEQTTCLHNQTNSCSHTVASPGLTAWQYVVFINHGSEEIKLDFSVDVSACPGFVAFLAGKLFLENRTHDCMVLPGLDRYVGYRDFRSYHGIFGLSAVLTPSTVLLENLVTIIPFSLDPAVDIGGTLKVALHAMMRGNGTGQEASVVGCIQRGSLGYHRDSVTPCEGHSDRQLAINLSDGYVVRQELYVPYPEPGTWYLSLALLCFTDKDHAHRKDCKNVSAAVEMDISTMQCVDLGCKNSGRCVTYLRGTSRFSTCNCVAGWRGYDCSDGSKAVSHGDQLEEALLLTLSNLSFIPAIVLAIYRSYFSEAIIYFMTMFFSTFYHACDGDRVLIYCMTRYDILSSCDFFGSVLSFWVTLVAMLRVKEPYTPTLLMMGTIGLVYGTLADKHSLWLYVAPAISGFTLIVISWGLRCYGRRHLYPSWRRYVFFLLPGGLIALLGICLFAFVETGANYKYVHSAWHVTMALSILFVLPPRPAWKLSKTTRKISSESDLHCSSSGDCVQIISSAELNDNNNGIVNVAMETLPNSDCSH